MYKIVKYRDIISGRDADTVKRYHLIEKLSKGFTAENKVALEMDQLLTEQLDMEMDTAQAVHVPKPSTTNNVRQSQPVKVDLEQQFQELFNALKNQQPH